MPHPLMKPGLLIAGHITRFRMDLPKAFDDVAKASALTQVLESRDPKIINAVVCSTAAGLQLRFDYKQLIFDECTPAGDALYSVVDLAIEHTR